MVSLDLGGLRSLPNKINSFVSGPLAQEVQNTVLLDIMPTLIASIGDSMGVSIGVDGRVKSSIVAGGAAGVSAGFQMEIIEDEREASESGVAKYGILPIIRNGGFVQIVVSRRPAAAGQKDYVSAFREAVNDENMVEGVILNQLMGAVRKANDS